MSRRRAVLDLGSNSVSLLIAEGPHIVLEKKDPVRLGAGMGNEQLIRPEAIDRAVEVVKGQVSISRRFGAGLPAGVATAAVRNARNQMEILRRLEATTGVRFKVLTGEEEATYDYLAVVNSLPVNDGLILDVGGGSCELVGVTNGQVAETACLPLGAVTVSEWLGNNDSFAPQDLRKAEFKIDQALASLPWLSLFRKTTIVGLGGTLRNLARIHCRRHKYPLEVIHGYEWPAGDLLELYLDLALLPHRLRRKLPGLSKARADIIVGGSMIPTRLINLLATERLLMSGHGLRNGLLLALERQRPVVDPLIQSANYFHSRFSPNWNSPQIARIALTIFDCLSSLQPIPSHLRCLLEAAATLSQIGREISFYHYARHGAYLLTQAPLLGATHRDIAIVAAVVASQGGSKLEEFIPLDEDSQNSARTLAVFLRFALALGENCPGKDPHISSRLAEEGLVIEARGCPPINLDYLKKDLVWLQKIMGLPNVDLRFRS